MHCQKEGGDEKKSKYHLIFVTWGALRRETTAEILYEGGTEQLIGRRVLGL